MKFADPRNDVAFKRIFGNKNHKEVLIHFVNAALDFPEGAKVVDVSFDNPYQPPKIEDLKETVLDVTATDQQQRTFIIEMQVQPSPHFARRSLYYTAKSYVNQLDKGAQYQKLKKVHFIGILDFDFSTDSKRYLSNHLILDTHTHKNHLDDFAFCFIELPKFHKTLDELDNVVDKWIYFIKNTVALEEVPALFQQDPVFKTAFEMAQQHAWSKQEMLVYDYVNKKRMDEYDAMEYTKQLAERTGLEKGMEKGKGIAARKTAKKLIPMGLSNEQIATATNLPLETVEAIRETFENGPGNT